MPHITTNDNIRIHYEEYGEGRPLIMIHGWTFSSRFFHRNIKALSEHARVITIDLRGHGQSDKPKHGYRMARLAADLKDVLEKLDLNDVTILGWSIGCPVIWAYLEIFGQNRLRNAIFVQQTPKQYYSSDWKLGHAACYDQAGLSALQQQVSLNSANFDQENLESCLNHPIADDEKKLFLNEMALCPSYARSAMMADHTEKDWRDVLPLFSIPAVMFIAHKDAIIPAEGAEWVSNHMPNCKAIHFDNSAHMIFVDETEKFNQAVINFLKS